MANSAVAGYERIIDEMDKVIFDLNEKIDGLTSSLADAVSQRDNWKRRAITAERDEHGEDRMKERKRRALRDHIVSMERSWIESSPLRLQETTGDEVV